MFKNCHASPKKVWAQNDPTTQKIQDTLKSEVVWRTHGCLLRLVWTREMSIFWMHSWYRIVVQKLSEKCHLNTKYGTRIFSKSDDDRWRELDIEPVRLRSLMSAIMKLYILEHEAPLVGNRQANCKVNLKLYVLLFC